MEDIYLYVHVFAFRSRLLNGGKPEGVETSGHKRTDCKQKRTRLVSADARPRLAAAKSA